MDRAIGFVVAHGDAVDRARLQWLRTGAAPAPDVLATAEFIIIDLKGRAANALRARYAFIWKM